MPKFKVFIEETVTTAYIIEAENADAAEQSVMEGNGEMMENDTEATDPRVVGSIEITEQPEQPVETVAEIPAN